MNRGFYRAPASVFAEGGEDTKTPASFGCIVLHRTLRTYYLHSATSPNEALEAAGGVFLGDTWLEVKAKMSIGVRDRVFRKRVRREVTLEGEMVVHTLTVPRADKDPSDVLEADWLPPHKFLGDPDPEPVP